MTVARRVRVLAALSAAGLGAALAQEKPFVERVEVNVRTVLVRITDRDGRVPSPLPGPEDIEVFEDAVSVRVLGVDPARPAGFSPAPSPRPGPSAPTPAPAMSAAPSEVSAGIPQHLYVDTTLLEAGSVTRLADAFGKSLGTILSNGTLEIVVADPQPRQLLAATRDETAARRALADLAKNVSGKQSLLAIRRQAVDTLRNGLCVNYEMTVRNAAEQEIRIVQDSLNRLLRWAASLGGQRPDLVYFVSDGFDSDVSETYRQVILQRATRPPSSSLCSGTLDLPGAQQLTSSLQQEFAPQGSAFIGTAARSLAALGVEAVPLALGGNNRDFGGDASTPGQDAFNSTTGTVPMFSRPIEPLRTIAETTGGEVVTSVRSLPAAVGAFDNAFVVSYRSDHPPDGKTHDLRVVSRRAGLTVRAPKFMSDGAADAAVGQTVRALNEPPAAGGLSVRLSIDGVASSGKETSGILHVDTDLASLVTTLDQLGGGRMRVTVAVDVQGAREPFTTKQEFDVPRRQAGWGADLPITWPPKGRRVAVTLEELKTGTRGTATLDLPK